MYLVDTSVWIDLLRQRDNTPVRILRFLLQNQLAFGITSTIYQEILQGARHEQDYQRLRDDFATQRFYHPQDPVRSYAQAARLYFECRQHGITIRSTIDCLIAQIAIEHDLILLHNDKDFTRLAQVEPTLELYQ